MGAARGIAGSWQPEVDGCFLADTEVFEYFVRMNNTGGPVDVWEVSGVDVADLVDAPSGYSYRPRAVPPTQLRLVGEDVPVSEEW